MYDKRFTWTVAHDFRLTAAQVLEAQMSIGYAKENLRVEFAHTVNFIDDVAGQIAGEPETLLDRPCAGSFYWYFE